MTKKNLMPSIVLSAICLAAALLLSVINMFTAPIIEERQNAAANAALVEVLPGGSNFKALELNENYPAAVQEAYSADGGFVFRVNGSGRNGDITVMIGVDADGKLVGTKVIAEGESKGYGDKVYAETEGTDGKYTGQTLDTFAPVIVAGATMTSNGFAGAVEAALKAYVVANGGAVENRTPEQILKDNCNAALGTTDVEFTKWFATEILEGIDAVYEAKDNGGRVYVIGESFVGVKSGAVTTSDATEENKAKALAADAVINASVLSDVEIPEGANADVVSIKKTASGNYVIEAKGSGFGIKGDKYYNPSKQKLIIKVCISADGAIIDSATVFEKETPDFGGALLKDPTFYDKFIGKTSENLEGVENVAGTTLTSKGYKEAIKYAFEAFELLTAEEGGNQ